MFGSAGESSTLAGGQHIPNTTMGIPNFHPSWRVLRTRPEHVRTKRPSLLRRLGQERIPRTGQSRASFVSTVNQPVRFTHVLSNFCPKPLCRPDGILQAGEDCFATCAFIQAPAKHVEHSASPDKHPYTCCGLLQSPSAHIHVHLPPRPGFFG